MGINSKRDYIPEARLDYQKARKSQKTFILDHFCFVTKLNRKYAIRVLGTGYKVPREKAGRPETYDKVLLLPHIKRLWFAMEQAGARKMKAAMPDWLPHYRGPDVTAEIISKLFQISAGTIERFLKPLRFQCRPYGLSTTRGGSLTKRIPIRTVDWNRKEPGHLEADTVAHCSRHEVVERSCSYGNLRTIYAVR